MAFDKILRATSLVVGISLSSFTWGAEQFVTIGTGSETGVYYPSGEAICKLVNQSWEKTNLLCSVEATGGSIANIEAIRNQQLEFGIVQSDWQYHGYQGTGPFTQPGGVESLRAVFSLYTEPFNIIARSDSGIETITDLAGKRVNLGNPGSGDRATMQVVMNEFHWNNASFKLAAELKGSERSQALCDNKIDAYIYLVGHPNGAISEATTSCNARLIPATGPEIDRIVASHPYYTYTSIPAGMYNDDAVEVKSFGVAATLLSRKDVSEQAVYNLVKSVFENFDTFVTLHPALAHLDKQQMISAGLSIPLHPGAEKYYREVGLIKE
jgi:TRAP transporter TAXI family solute receptor